MKFFHRLLFFALVTGVSSLVGMKPLLAQSSLEANRNLVTHGVPAPPPGAQKARHLTGEATAAIDLGNDQVVTVSSHQGGFDRVGLRHDQTIDVRVQYSAAKIGQPITVEALDGGSVVAASKDLVVAADGTIHFKFRAGHQPGVYQIAVRNGSQELGLQFWVRDDEHPGNNQPVINLEGK
ncbi:MAG TPA: hypothetical protein VJU77_06920 [Chthoniobacterales bacterium]|nr:hypothetical protein [Chthoniobacterales bacterium]